MIIKLMNKTILVFAAHPDDEVLGCGGTIARYAHEGADVHIVFFTDGVGARSVNLSAEDNFVGENRRHAAELAGKTLGAKTVIFGDFPDNRMDSIDLLDIVQFVEKKVKNYVPTLIFTHHSGDLNIDHRIVHQAVVTACRPQPGFSVEMLLFFEVPSSTEWQTPGSAPSFSPNYFIDISDYMLTRLRAFEVYAEEFRSWPHSRSYEALEHLARWRGATAGVQAAEAFMFGRGIINKV